MVPNFFPIRLTMLMLLTNENGELGIWNSHFCFKSLSNSFLDVDFLPSTLLLDGLLKMDFLLGFHDIKWCANDVLFSIYKAFLILPRKSFYLLKKITRHLHMLLTYSSNLIFKTIKKWSKKSYFLVPMNEKNNNEIFSIEK